MGAECGHEHCGLMLQALPWISPSICLDKAASTNPLTARAIEKIRADMAAEGRKPAFAARRIA